MIWDHCFAMEQKSWHRLSHPYRFCADRLTRPTLRQELTNAVYTGQLSKDCRLHGGRPSPLGRLRDAGRAGLSLTTSLRECIRKYFQATASTLIYGVRDAVLVDAFTTVKQACALADWIAARGKTLTTIYVTHGHGSHWFGVGTLDRFQNAPKAVATSNVVKVMRQNASPEALEGFWKAALPGQIPDKLVIAEELKEKRHRIWKGINWSLWNWAILTPTTRPACTSLLSDSW